ncbi:cysteine hydrolase family protein [Rhizobium jaguaris]|uniref:Cysteine hydrolase n=1 Tax=Rhizobium jaguaris TaxID=1312183 RepID=A0A387FX94_9HYPH|nr:cysteine hydrolase [Rhizobium jaguaris]AYG62377.1 cysteine hydrolase [Rhizobium jaguaris]
MMTRAPLSGNTLHVAIDMQRLFAEETAWFTPALAGIVPNVQRLAKARPESTVFARFIPAQRPKDAKGRWQAYYERWKKVTLDELDPAMLDLVAPLAALVQPGSIVDKETYSIFGAPGFGDRVDATGVDTIVFTGVETDVCVYASALDAVDLGYRVILVSDALASGEMVAHETVLTRLAPRFSEQIEILTTEDILDSWPA